MSFVGSFGRRTRETVLSLQGLGHGLSEFAVTSSDVLFVTDVILRVDGGRSAAVGHVSVGEHRAPGGLSVRAPDGVGRAELHDRHTGSRGAPQNVTGATHFEQSPEEIGLDDTRESPRRVWLSSRRRCLTPAATATASRGARPRGTRNRRLDAQALPRVPRARAGHQGLVGTRPLAAEPSGTRD